MNKSGFSLVEVALAVLLVGIGLTTIFALFPLGLQQSDGAIQDTQEAMFVDYVFNTIEGNCLTNTSWTVWSDDVKFVNMALKGIDSNLVPGNGTWQNYTEDGIVGRRVQCTNLADAIEYPDQGALGFSRYLRYELKIKNMDRSGTLKKIEMSVKSGRYGKFDFPQTYLTRVVYLGM